MKHTKHDHHRIGRVLVLTSTFAVGGFVTWASWADIDQITRAQGQVIASSRNQVIQSPDGGIVDELLVKQGSVVKRGQVLVRFDRKKATALYLESVAKTAALGATAARLHAEVYGGEPKFPPVLAAYPAIRTNEEVLFRKRQAAVNEEISALKQSLDLVKSELDINLPLLATGDVAKTEVLKLQRQVAEIQGQMTNRRNKYMQDSQAELARALEELAGADQVLAQRKDQLDHVVITSPMDGIVRNVRITTLGGVARAGDEVMQIVPVDDDLLIEAKVKPTDIGFLKPGLPATIKLDAYDYTIYGTLHGSLVYISADTFNEDGRNSSEQPFYRVQIKANGRNFDGMAAERIEIQPGMTATVEIRTGSHSVLNFLTKPITKTLAESFGER